MAKSGAGFKSKLNSFSKDEKYLLYAAAVTAISYVLPWYGGPGGSSTNGLLGVGFLLFLTVVASAVLLFSGKNKKYAGYAALVSVITILGYLNNLITGYFGYLSPKIGIHLAFLGSIAMVYLGIKTSGLLGKMSGKKR